LPGRNDRLASLFPLRDSPVIPTGASRRFFFHVRSCERVGSRSGGTLRIALRDESLFDQSVEAFFFFVVSFFPFDFQLSTVNLLS
jgi:hypothetical protein